jgi:hypothetical protein
MPIFGKVKSAAASVADNDCEVSHETHAARQNDTQTAIGEKGDRYWPVFGADHAIRCCRRKVRRTSDCTEFSVTARGPFGQANRAVQMDIVSLA